MYRVHMYVGIPRPTVRSPIKFFENAINISDDTVHDNDAVFLWDIVIDTT